MSEINKKTVKQKKDSISLMFMLSFFSVKQYYVVKGLY